MNRFTHPKHRPPIRTKYAAAYRPAFERLEAALARERERQHNQEQENLVERERINRARLALFGCAPK